MVCVSRIALLLALMSWNGVSASPGKRAFTAADFDPWRAITSATLSNDGSWLTYACMPQEGDGDLMLRELATGHEQRVPVGALPPVPVTGSEADPERAPPRRTVRPVFSFDGRFVIANTFPNRSDTLLARRAGKSGSALPPEGIVIIPLPDGATTHLSGVKSFQLPARGDSWLAYLRASGELVLRNLANATERSFANVTDYSLARDGRTLVFTADSADAAQNGVFAITPGDPAAPRALAAGAGRYTKFTWNRAQTQAVFLSSRDVPAASAPRLAAYFWKRGDTPAIRILAADAPGIPAGWMLSGDTSPTFSADGTKLHLATAPIPPVPDPRVTDQLDEETVRADLWRWNDDFIQPLQKVRADQDRRRSYVGELDLATGRFRQLADPTLQTLLFNNDGSAAVGFDDRPYRRRIDYDGFYHDLYLVDASTGKRTLVVRELAEKSGASWSPDNRWLAYFAERQWFAIDRRDASVRNLSGSLPFPVHQERHDLPEMPGAYGTAGWTRDGQSLLIYDRYDLWQVFPDGRPPRSLTGGYGRRNRIELRLQSLEVAEPGDADRGIDISQPLVFRGEEESTRDTGFFRFATIGAEPERLLWANKDYRFVGRASASDTVLLTASRFDEFPDLLLTDSLFRSPHKVSNGGAQLEPFLWGSAELMPYHGPDGQELTAMLCKPANFDPSRKYPMIVYIYERLSPIVNRFMAPAPTAVIDPAFYTSNGYLVLMPDIVYVTGHPGPSAYRCVMAAVDAAVAKGFVDEDALGLEGHSWGGYETCYILTQTNRFRAAEAGAIVGNMTSASAAVGASSGRSRQFKYEKNQSRIGATLQEAPQLYIENSPVFLADRVRTPLLILHNDHDDIVPWPQAVEFFLALRRHGREAYLFNYNDELHGLRRRADQQDFARRMHQFFDHFLKGAPAPAWMTDGIPYLDRDNEKLRFRESR